jgi:hypothetical protein
MSNDFEDWYEANFGNLLGAQDAENKATMRWLWSLIIERVARSVEISIFEDISGEKVAAMIRRMGK